MFSLFAFKNVSKRNLILISFFVGCLVFYATSVIIHNNPLNLVLKTLLLPIIFVYFLYKLKNLVHDIYFISFLVFYISEVLTLVDAEKYHNIIVLFYLIPFLFLLFYIIQEALFVKKSDIIDKNNTRYFLGFIFVFLIGTSMSLLFIIDFTSFTEKLLFISYAFVISLLGTSSNAILVLKNRSYNIHLFLTVLTFMVYALFYVIVNKIDNNLVFIIVGNICEVLSYYFFASYYYLKLKSSLNE